MAINARNLEDMIRTVEGFDVLIADPMTLELYEGDDLFPDYPFNNSANANMTVARWMKISFSRIYPKCHVFVVDPFGNLFRGNTVLKNVRSCYAFDD